MVVRAYAAGDASVHQAGATGVYPIGAALNGIQDCCHSIEQRRNACLIKNF